MYSDLVPTKVFDAGGKPTTFAATQFQIELEYGLARRFELGLYLTFAPTAGDSLSGYPIMPEGNGVKERVKYHATGPLAPIDLSFYLELAETNREVELEGKIIGERRFGPVRAIANYWMEREQYYDGHGEWCFNPTAGLVLEAAPFIQPGIESWMHVEVPDGADGDEGPTPGKARPFALGPHVYVGPTLLFSFSKLWWSTGVYFRVTDVDRPTQVGDAFGKLWLRALFGIPL
jgi:hypothetical protein